MLLPTPLHPARFLRRVNRFLAEVEWRGRVVPVHVPNSGRNRELFTPGREVRIHPRPAPTRRTAFDLALVRYNHRWVSVDARVPNRLVEEAWREGRLPGFRRYREARREVMLGDSRLDLLFQRGRERCFVEVKSVTLVKRKVALFPDAPTARGSRHVAVLTEAVHAGRRAAVVFVIQRADAEAVSPNVDADPEFVAACHLARKSGVRLLAFRCRVTTRVLTLTTAVPVRLPPLPGRPA